MKQIPKKLLERILYYLSAQDSTKDLMEIYHEVQNILNDNMTTELDKLGERLDNRITDLNKYVCDESRRLSDEIRHFKIEMERKCLKN